MSQYTTGELAKLCGVTVRTVQYYDTRGIVVPSGLSEGGRRLYSDADLKRMKIVCFLRGLGISIDNVSKILAEDNSKEVVSLLLEQQKRDLCEEIGELKERAEKLDALTRELKGMDGITAESIGDAAYLMSNSRIMKKIRRNMILICIPLAVIQILAVILWIAKGMWWLYAAALALTVPVAIFMSLYYYRKVAFICPGCHAVFRPSFGAVVFAAHTPKTRKLTCTGCGRRGYCVEVARGEEEK
ncbi:MAG: MerR family transcriptional regulator [Clostridiales bacterium]|nr:MerR family transcriptional regulator [Clostridiales bacterium]